MDIFQVLEALQPQNKVITIQLNTPKDYLAPFLPLIPSVVAICALIFSAWQFKATIKNQIKLAQINARISTDIEMKKEWCRDVRRLCIEVLTSGTDSHTYTRRMSVLIKQHEEGNKFEGEKYHKYSDEQHTSFYKTLEAKSLLSLYLDPIDHTDFVQLINSFTSLINREDVSPEDVGNARGLCINAARELLFEKNAEISQISGELV